MTLQTTMVVQQHEEEKEQEEEAMGQVVTSTTESESTSLERHSKRQKVLPSSSSSSHSSESQTQSLSCPSSSSSSSVGPLVVVVPTTTTVAANAAAKKKHKRVLSSSLIADFILPFVSKRKCWNALALADQELFHASRPLIPPWPHGKTINLRGTPWPVSIALSSPLQAEWMACGTEEGGMIRLWNCRTGRCTVLGHPPQLQEQPLPLPLPQQQHQHPHQQYEQERPHPYEPQHDHHHHHQQQHLQQQPLEPQQPQYQNPGGVVHVEFSPKNAPFVQMLSCCEDGTVRIWDLSQPREPQQPQAEQVGTDEVAPMALDSDATSQSRSENDTGDVTMVVRPTFPSRLFGDFAKLHRIGGGHTRASFSPYNGRHLACATWRTKSIDPLTGRFCVLSIWNVQEGVCLRKWGAGAEQWNGANLVHNFGFYSVLFHPNYNDGDDKEENDDNHESNSINGKNNNNNGAEKENENEHDKDSGRDNNDTSSSNSSHGSNSHCQYLVTQYCDKRNTAQVWELTKKVRLMPSSIHHSNNDNGHNNYYYEDYTVPHKDLISTSGGRCRHLQPLRVNLPPAVFVKQGVGDRRILAERLPTTTTTINRRNSDTDTTSTSTTVVPIPDPRIDENKNVISSSSSTLSPWLLALGGTQKIGLWSIPEGIQERQASHDVYRIMAMAVSPDGNVLATSNAVGDANLWSTRDGRLLRALSEPSCNLHAMKFTNNGQTLVCVGMTGTLQLCDASF